MSRHLDLLRILQIELLVWRTVNERRFNHTGSVICLVFYMIAGYLTQVRREDDMVVFVHCPEIYDVKEARKNHIQYYY